MNPKGRCCYSDFQQQRAELSPNFQVKNRKGTIKGQVGFLLAAVEFHDLLRLDFSRKNKNDKGLLVPLRVGTEQKTCKAVFCRHLLY